MRSLKLGIVILFSVLLSLGFLPNISYSSERLKIGVIDVQKILNESDAGQKAKNDLEALIKSKQITIDEKGKAIEKLKNEIEKQSSVLSSEARKNKEDDLEKLIREYQRLVQDSQSEVKKKETELTDIILREIYELVNKIGEEESYSLILERSVAIYSDKSLDITEYVLKKYNESKAKTKK